MSKKIRTEFVIEIDRVYLFDPKEDFTAWCAGCADHVKMVTPDQAATLAGVFTRRIYQWVEAESIHYWETPQGLLLVCLNSLYYTRTTGQLPS